AGSGWRALDLREVWDYRELLHILVWRDLKVRYRQTFLGVVWVVAQPLLTTLVFTLLFNRLAHISAGGAVPYSLFVLVALVPWTFFSGGVTASSNSLIGNAHLISKVYFPRLIVPSASVLAGIVDMGVTLALVMAMLIFSHVPITASLALLPFAIILCAIFALGVGLWMSALNVEYRDVKVLVPFLLQLWMYATPVVYPLSVIPGRFRWIATLNPMTGIVELFRASLLGASVSWSSVAYAVAVTIVITVGGAFYFRRMERLFADVL
ncbi:MAG TPA: ABC transporter permease, partial [Thermoanaerobaculia bacterium]|nr:ABC transporter permease [Thermoanaerobaculia bacterium]